MSVLAARAEAAKLEAVLGADPALRAALETLPAQDLRQLRTALDERLFALEVTPFRRLAWLAGWLPVWLLRWLCLHWLGPRLTARTAVFLRAEKAARIGAALPDAFLAEVARQLDPRRARDLIHALPVERIVGAAKALLAQRDFITIGRFVEFLPDAAVRAVEPHIAEDAELLQIAYFLESRERLDHVLQLIPRERVERTVLLVIQPETRPLWPLILSLIAHVSYSEKRALGDLAAAQGEAVLEAIVATAQEEGLWPDLLPVVACLSPEVQREVVNLRAIRAPEVMGAIIAAVEREALWSAMLPLVRYMQAPAIDAVARVAETLDDAAIGQAVHAALLGEQWRALFEILRRFSGERQQECVDIALGITAVDAELVERLIALAADYDMADLIRERWRRFAPPDPAASSAAAPSAAAAHPAGA